MKKNLFFALCLFVIASFDFAFSPVEVRAQSTESELQTAADISAIGTKQFLVADATDSVKNPVNVLALEHLVFDLINKKRAEFGLSPVAWSDDLERLAHAYSNDMATNNFFSHQGLDGKMVNNRADAMGITRWHSLGENIAYNRGYASPAESVVESWMKSAGHRENILNNRWQKSGVGIAVTPEGAYYFTQVFLRK
ncbi:MAG: CAP domain-containing protein [Acidobacteriota bacterium]|nr:CAP domain-containing protein [Acidobacteriota bacterium]